MKATAYVYDEQTAQCVFVVTGERANVEWEIAAHFQANGTPATFYADCISGIDTAETIEV